MPDCILNLISQKESMPKYIMMWYLYQHTKNHFLGLGEPKYTKVL